MSLRTLKRFTRLAVHEDSAVDDGSYYGPVREPPAIRVIDLDYLGLPQMIASYLVVGPAGPVLIETGPGSTFKRLTAGLKEHGFAVSDITEVLVTHIHLDHAGAAGHLAREGARIHVHEFGAKHLIDPARLIDSARRIYGDQMERLWGEMLPVPVEQVAPLYDGDVIEVSGLHFGVMYTPGHARHHCCFSLQVGRQRVCFAGDAAGMVVPLEKAPRQRADSTDDVDPIQAARRACVSHAHNFISLPTPPPEFDLKLWLESINRIDRGRFRSLFLTHFGEVRTPDSHLLAVRRSLRAHTEFVRSGMRRGLSESAILDQYRSWVLRQATAAGINAEQAREVVSDHLLRMNVAGIMRYEESLRPERGRP